MHYVISAKLKRLSSTIIRVLPVITRPIIRVLSVPLDAFYQSYRRSMNCPIVCVLQFDRTRTISPIKRDLPVKLDASYQYDQMRLTSQLDAHYACDRLLYARCKLDPWDESRFSINMQESIQKIIENLIRPSYSFTIIRRH